MKVEVQKNDRSVNLVKNLNEIKNGIDEILLKLDPSRGILNERDRNLLVTRYLTSLCQKSQGNQQAKFSKAEIYENAQLGGYNDKIVIPFIIEKLKGLGYLKEYDSNNVGITASGKEHCGEEIMLGYK
jgi:hypothetical protein